MRCSRAELLAMGTALWAVVEVVVEELMAVLTQPTDDVGRLGRLQPRRGAARQLQEARSRRRRLAGGAVNGAVGIGDVNCMQNGVEDVR